MNYGSAPDPFPRSTGDGHVAPSLCTSLLSAQRGRPGRCCTLLRLSHRCVQFLTVQREVFLIFNGHRSRWPQPRKSGGDNTPRKDTRREHWRCSAQVLLVVECLLSSYGRAARVVEHEQVKYSSKGHWAPQLLTKGHGAEQRTASSSHETQRLATGGQSPRYREYARPAASWECRDHGVDSQAGTPARATNPKTGGRLTQATSGTNPTTGQVDVTFRP